MDDTLSELGLSEKPRITAFNKVDLLVQHDGSAIADLEELAKFDLSLAAHRPDAVLCSAERRWGLDDVVARIDGALGRAARASAPSRSRRDAWAGASS